MKILALTKYDSLGASSRMRVLQYIPYLKKDGFDIDTHNLFDNKYVELLQSNKRHPFKILKAYIKRACILLNSKKYDLIWIEKEALPWVPFFIENLFISANVHYVIDYDDAVFHWYEKSDNFLIKLFLKRKHLSLIRSAKCVIVGNAYLRDYCFSAKARRIEYLPTAVNFKKYEDFSYKQQSIENLPVIGWIGQQSTAYNLMPLKNIFLELVGENKASLSLIGIDGQFLDCPVTSIPWTDEDEAQHISTFDIGIMPLADGPFERGKCGYKLIQYMSCGIPVIGSGVGENTNIIDHGKNGFIANTPSEWNEYLAILIKDPALRERMGRAGKGKILNGYRTHVTSPKLSELFKELLKDSR